MTLKTSYFKLMKEDRRRRIWTIVVFSILCFMMTAAFEMNLELYELNSASDGFTLFSRIEQLTSYGYLSVYLLFSGIGALLYGFQGFGWLTKKEQVDFYHSQPMKRETRFGIIFLNGFFMFEIPMLLHMTVGAALIAMRDCLTSTVVGNMLMNILVFSVSFLLIYSLVILAVMFTGNLIVSFMASGVFFVYPSVVRVLIESYYSVYFETYTSRYETPLAILSKISPFECIVELAENMTGLRGVSFWQNLLLVIGIAAVFFVAAFLLYKRRPSESAGRALAFPVVGNVIRFLIVIPGALAFGMMFSAFSGLDSALWLYFGTVVGAVLTHGFMEVVFHFDIRAITSKKKQMVFATILSIAVVSLFRFDLLGYDTYLPEEKDVKKVSYYVDLGEYTDYYLELDEEGVPVYVTQPEEAHQISRSEYQLSKTTTEEAGQILNLVQAYMMDDKNDDDITKQLLVCYELQSGRKVYRRYYVDVAVLEKEFASIYATEEGKKIIYPYLHLSGKEVDAVSVYTPYMSTAKNIDLNQKEIEELAACYQKDICARTCSQLFSDKILGCVTLHYKVENSAENVELNLYVSETDENLKAFLLEHGVTMTLPNDEYVIDGIWAYNSYSEEETQTHDFWQGRSQVLLSDSEQEQIQPYLVMDEYMFSGGYTDYMYYFEVNVRNVKTGSKNTMFCYISSENAPEWIKLDQK